MEKNILDKCRSSSIRRLEHDHFFKSFPIYHAPVTLPYTLHHLKFCRPCHRNSYSAYFGTLYLEYFNVQYLISICEIHQGIVITWNCRKVLTFGVTTRRMCLSIMNRDAIRFCLKVFWCINFLLMYNLKAQSFWSAIELF